MATEVKASHILVATEDEKKSLIPEEYKDNVLIEQKISNVPDMTIQEFINFLDNLIKNYENGSY